MEHAHSIFPSPIGPLAVTASDKGVVSVLFTDEPVHISSSHPILEACAKQLAAYFSGSSQTFNLPLDMQGTEFQLRVWNCLLEIPFGQSLSYLEEARKLGDEKAIRAVAAANGQNPVAILVPCHRVIGSDGSLTGYAGGVWRKEWLLRHEKHPYFRQQVIEGL
ncbi:MAG: methylated-DNA--[protein]-cysteine S-methyltransferase [Flavobacteriales bacterium]|nr:methylated-DNA--[protein]-cysteine S-methyltransferase [Flavobacteriales bacterium]MCB9449516.1 methylated-DNA--[protein]-cysteine S-methyltransferase [Flavobacteriales bacterium]